jgi:hypothetical protein
MTQVTCFSQYAEIYHFQKARFQAQSDFALILQSYYNWQCIIYVVLHLVFCFILRYYTFIILYMYVCALSVIGAWLLIQHLNKNESNYYICSPRDETLSNIQILTINIF